jgi:hypothetical protein
VCKNICEEEWKRVTHKAQGMSGKIRKREGRDGGLYSKVVKV